MVLLTMKLIRNNENDNDIDYDDYNYLSSDGTNRKVIAINWVTRLSFLI